MNRQEWEKEKERILEQATKDLKKFEKDNGGKKKLQQVSKTINRHRKLKARANKKNLEGKLPENHVMCDGHNFDKSSYRFTYCHEIIDIKELDKKGWYKEKYACGHFNSKYYCPEHKKYGEERERDSTEECGWCEQR